MYSPQHLTPNLPWHVEAVKRPGEPDLVPESPLFERDLICDHTDSDMLKIDQQHSVPNNHWLHKCFMHVGYFKQHSRVMIAILQSHLVSKGSTWQDRLKWGLFECRSHIGCFSVSSSSYPFLLSILEDFFPGCEILGKEDTVISKSTSETRQVFQTSTVDFVFAAKEALPQDWKHGGEDLEQVARFDHLLMATLQSRASKIGTGPENLCQSNHNQAPQISCVP